MTGLPETWIQLDAADIRSMRWRTVVLHLIFLLFAVAVLVLPPGRGQAMDPLVDRLWEVGGVCVFWFLVLFPTLNARYGRTLLTVEGMRFHTWVSRRFVPWREIADVEIRFHRNSCSVGVRRRHGRRLIVPGTLSVHRRGSLDENFRTIKRYWSHAARPKH